MLDLASSRRFSIARALGSCRSDDPELHLALAEWEAREDDPTVRKFVRRALDALRAQANPAQAMCDDFAAGRIYPVRSVTPPTRTPETRP